MARFVLLILVFWPFIVNSQDKISVEPAPGWVKSVPYLTEASDTANSGGYYYLLLERQFDVDRNEFYSRTSVKVLTEKGLEDASTINVNFNPAFEKLVFHSVNIRRGSENLDKLKIGQFQLLRREENLDRLVYDKSLNAILNLEDVQVGDVIEYSYSIRGNNPVFNNTFFKTLYFNYSQPIGKIFTSVKSSKKRNLRYKLFNKAIEPQKTEFGNSHIFTWDHSNVPALLIEDNVPSWYDAYSNVEISEYGSWHEVAEWAVPLYLTKSISSEAIDAKLAELKSKYPDTLDIVNACIAFVQDEIRYLSFSDGIQGYKPHKPDEVFNQRFGDCKDKSLLLCFMLRKVGIESYPALVSTSFGKSIGESLPSPGIFDHCIAQVIIHDSIYWIDPTITLQRGNLRSRSALPYNKALVISNRVNELSAIPFDPSFSGIKVQEDFTFKIIGGSANLRVKTSYHGDEAGSMRNYWKSNSPEEIKKSYTNFYANDFSEIQLNKYVEFEDDEKENRITTYEDYTIDNLWGYDSVSGLYVAEFYARMLAGYLHLPATKNRSMPYSISHPIDIQQTIVIHVPEPWTVAENQKTISTSSFHFTSETDYVGNEIKLYYKYKSLRDHVQPHEIKDFLNKMGKAKNSLSLQLTYATKSSTTDSFSIPILIICIMVLPIFLIGARTLYYFDPRAKDYEFSYDQIGGWLILPAIGIFISPFRNLLNIVNGEYFSDEHWRVLIDSTYHGYNPPLGLWNLISLIYSVAIFVFSGLLILLLLQRRTSFPALACLLYGLNVAYLIGETVWLGALGLPTQFHASSIGYPIATIIGALIWIPFFVYADRVKGTFRERLK